jgi:hypothetical protein
MTSHPVYIQFGQRPPNEKSQLISMAVGLVTMKPMHAQLSAPYQHREVMPSFQPECPA